MDVIVAQSLFTDISVTITVTRRPAGGKNRAGILFFFSLPTPSCHGTSRNHLTVDISIVEEKFSFIMMSIFVLNDASM